MQGTWKTTSNGGGTIAAIVTGIILAAALVGPVVHAAVDLLHIVVEILAITFVTGLASGLALVGLRMRRRGTPPVVVRQVRDRTPQAVPGTHRTALPPAQEVHFHFHGMSPDEVAEAIRRGQQ